MQIFYLLLDSPLRHFNLVTTPGWHILELRTVQFLLPIVEFLIQLLIDLLNYFSLLIKFNESAWNWLNPVDSFIQDDAIKYLMGIVGDTVETSLLLNLNSKEILRFDFGFVCIHYGYQFLQILRFNWLFMGVEVLKQFLEFYHVLKQFSNLSDLDDGGVIHLIVVLVFHPLVFPARRFVSHPVKHLGYSTLEIRKCFEFIKEWLKIWEIFKHISYSTLPL